MRAAGFFSLKAGKVSLGDPVNYYQQNPTLYNLSKSGFLCVSSGESQTNSLSSVLSNTDSFLKILFHSKCRRRKYSQSHRKNSLNNTCAFGTITFRVFALHILPLKFWGYNFLF